jgi:hypothetical protein
MILGVADLGKCDEITAMTKIGGAIAGKVIY